jgi:hypothetical protein
MMRKDPPKKANGRGNGSGKEPPGGGGGSDRPRGKPVPEALKKRVRRKPPAGTVATSRRSTSSGKGATGDVLGCSVIRCPWPHMG